jgi:ATP-dependent protease ClpP protease subunit
MKYLHALVLLPLLSCSVSQAATPDASAAEGITYTCIQQPCVLQGVIAGPIDDDIADEFAKMLDAARAAGANAFVLGIMSPGGNFHASFRIFQAIQKSKMPVHCYVRKMAASGAFWILQACTERVAEPDVTLMIHAPLVVTPGSVVLKRQDLVMILERLRLLETIMVGTIAPKMKLTPAALSDKLAQGDWFMNPVAAIAAHALDSIWSGAFSEYVRDVQKRMN